MGKRRGEQNYSHKGRLKHKLKKWLLLSVDGPDIFVANDANSANLGPPAYSVQFAADIWLWLCALL